MSRDITTAPSAGLEPAHPAPEAGALSAELRGPATWPAPPQAGSLPCILSLVRPSSHGVSTAETLAEAVAGALGRDRRDHRPGGGPHPAAGSSRARGLVDQRRPRGGQAARAQPAGRGRGAGGAASPGPAPLCGGGRGRRAGFHQLPPLARLAPRRAQGGGDRAGEDGYARPDLGARRAGADRVRLRQPDGAPPCRQRLVRLLRGRPRPPHEPGRLGGHAGVLRQRHRQPAADARRERAGPPPGRRGAGGGLPGRVRRRHRRRLRRPGRRDGSRPVRRRAHPGEHPLDARPDEHPVRRVVLAGLDRGQRQGGRDDRSLARAGPRLRGGGRRLVPGDDVR